MAGAARDDESNQPQQRTLLPGRLAAGAGRLRLPVPVLALLLALAFGGLRYQIAQPRLDDPGQIAYYNDTESAYQVEAILLAPPEVRETRLDLRLRAENMRPLDGDVPVAVRGDLLATTWDMQDWRYGDRLRLQGTLETPPESEEFSYRQYLARQRIYTIMQPDEIELLEREQGNPLLAEFYAFKQRALDTLYRLYPDPEASLFAGILLGVESGIPEEVERAFQDSGTAHIVAISGFNIAILAGLFAAIFSRLLGRWRGAVVALACIAVYTLLVGAGASVVRAALMGGLTLLAAQIGRRQAGLNSLAFVAALMALFNPYVLWDVGFQLSFMATLGLVLYAGLLTGAFVRLAGQRVPLETAQKVARPVGEYLLFTLAATLTTLPVIAYHFQRLSLVSLLANPFILPAQPPLMVLGGLAMSLGMLYLPLGKALAWLSWPFAVYSIRLAELFAGLPGSTMTLGRISLGWVAAFYLALFGLTFYGGRLRTWIAARTGGRPLSRTALPGAVLLGLGLLAVLVWRAALLAPDGRLHLTVLDVGSGDALLVQSPTGRYLLVDGGPSPSRLADALGRRLPLGKRLDWLLVAGGSEEQVAALPALIERAPPEEVLWAGPTTGSQSARRLHELFSQVQIQPVLAETGHVLDLGDGVQMQVLASGPRGAVLLLEWGSFRLLLPVGIDFDTLEDLQDDPSLGEVTALLLAESGYAPANPPEWIEKLSPEVVLLSVAAGDREGRPDPEMLEAVDGYTLLRTDRDGWIELITDGEQMWVEVGRR